MSVNYFEKIKTIINPIKGILLILIGNLFTAITNYLYKYSTERKVPPSILIMYRGVFYCIISSIIIGFKIYKQHKLGFRYDVVSSLIFRGLLSAIGKSTAIVAIQYLRVSTFELLLRTGSAFGVFIAYLAIDEIITLYDIYGILGSILGSIFILKPSIFFGHNHSNAGSDSSFGILLALCVAFLISIGQVTAKSLLKIFDEFFLLFMMGFMSIVMSVFSLSYQSIDLGIPLSSFIFNFFITIIEYTGMFCTMNALKFESITKLAPFTNSRIIYSMIINYLLFNDIDRFDIIGATIIVTVYIIISYKKISETNKKTSDEQGS